MVLSGTDSETLRTARTPPKLLLTLFALNKLNDSAGHEKDDERERQSIDHQSQLAEPAQELRQESQHHRADHRPDHRSHAADDHHRHHGERLDDVEGVGHERADEARIEHARQRADAGPDAERERLPYVAAHTERGRRHLVLADGAQRVADRRAHQVVHQPVDEDRDAGDQVEQADGAADRRHDAVDAAYAFRDALPVHQDLVCDDREAERGDREIVPAQPHREGSEREADHAGEGDRRKRRQPEVPVVRLHQYGGDVRADAEERRLAEVQLAGVAKDEVQPKREQHVHRADHQDAAPIWRGHQPGQRAYRRDGERKIEGAPAQTFSSLRSAMMPVGRTTSMASSSTNTTRSMRPEPRYCTVKASMMPTRMPAMIVPCMLPKPPMITIAKAFTTTEAPANGVSTSTGPSSAPAIPASADAMTMVRPISNPGLMPIRPAVSRSCATARNALPRNVYRMNA